MQKAKIPLCVHISNISFESRNTEIKLEMKDLRYNKKILRCNINF